MRTWKREPVLDEHAEDGEGVVMLHDGRVLALSSLAWALVEALTDGEKPEPELVEVLTARFGAAVDDDGRDVSADLTTEALKSLAGEGVLSTRKGGVQSPRQG